MSDTALEPVRLVDYRVPAFLIDTVHLDIGLDRTQTRIVATLAIRRNPASEERGPLKLDGDSLLFVEAWLDGVPLQTRDCIALPQSFTLHHVPEGSFTLTIETRLDPSANTQLMGLYRSNSAYCTQCEAEGFRRITYFLDRPDVLSVYTTRIEASFQEAPALLANGNKIEDGVLNHGRHFAVWHDPFPKPSYLFAMVAGDLAVVRDSFVTASGRHVRLEIYVEHGKESRCTYAMDALKRSMRWDEQVFGREYDLDIFMIVAVSDFNMGAMENKGLNVFNDKYVLALPETATDLDYANIEAIIAHEYFHNWTGNRITCRDWFQLCLKEGLTVFRDQEFSSDQRSRPVKRINDVKTLRSQQFSEDGGPLAHPVRPEIYNEINNFYTATVYEKGAEVVRMLKTLIGDEAFGKGMDLYFERHDGEAVTIEDFIACFADASGRDLSQFMLWYRQSGTPEIRAEGVWDESGGTYALTLSQILPATPGQPQKQPMLFPIRLGLVGVKGDLPIRLDGEHFDGLVALTEPQQSFLFSDVGEKPVPSLLRGFSAPVKLAVDLDEEALLTLLRADSDPFNRWQAAQSYALKLLLRLVKDSATPIDPRFVEAISGILARGGDDPAFAALSLALPSEADIAREIGSDVDPQAIYGARTKLRSTLGSHLGAELLRTIEMMSIDGPYSPQARDAGRRSLRNVALELACANGSKAALAVAQAQFDNANNMTDEMAALNTLALSGTAAGEQALQGFRERYGSDPLVVDKWMSVQAMLPHETTLARVKDLMRDSAFSLHNPNRVRALIGAFSANNQTQFNRPNGEGYSFIADIILSIDPKNPQLAARLLVAFKMWRSLEAGRRALAAATLRDIAARPGLSRDVADIVQRSLA
ncbi:aminopeptidase N [Labrys miyagiensis]|uniref:Aminopeptidase N n=1 Tax=Labrys miyagiensis TaxID=346912 RepID=A0ABQ6CT17_9HYPH|nr:aminopeptidase N [Labrys miyagiensis]GLS22879.1 aminopeptidase N [Labrys miyagiensis]